MTEREANKILEILLDIRFAMFEKYFEEVGNN